MDTNENTGVGAGVDSAGNAEGGVVQVSPAELPQLDASQKRGDQADDLNLKMILDIPVDIHVELGNTQLSIKDILKLGAGSVIELDRPAGSPADIVVNGKLIGQGDVVVVDENFGIRISKLVDPEERIDYL